VVALFSALLDRFWLIGKAMHCDLVLTHRWAGISQSIDRSWGASVVLVETVSSVYTRLRMNSGAFFARDVPSIEAFGNNFFE
jgi:hypothetical protein